MLRDCPVETALTCLMLKGSGRNGWSKKKSASVIQKKDLGGKKHTSSV
jgi:hypothetical protein